MTKNNLSNYLFREKVIALTRQFFLQKNYQEITLPLLRRALPLEPNVYSFSTHWQYLKDNLYLQTSPESGLKALMSQGLGNCFSISQCFRDLEAKGPHHQPEFTMLEWYQINSNYQKIITQTQDLIINIAQGISKDDDNRINYLLKYQNRTIDLTPPWPQITFQKLFSDLAGVTKLPDNEPDLNQIFLNDIEPRLPLDRPLFITDYPSFISPLAKQSSRIMDFSDRKNSPASGQLAQRFELYIAGMEIANGCTENTDADLITKNFAAESDYRQKNNLPAHKIDSHFALDSAALPPTAGCGLGLDRLSMLFADVNSLDLIRPLPL
ncbi:MAG TPA: amino acid--tRNA ligase-related protein [Patescibacteria group bacterium]